jgi:hypothetical protein
MNILNKLSNRFNSLFKTKVISVKFCRGCLQNIPTHLYNHKLKLHIIGAVTKYGDKFVLYCDGKECK